MLIDRPEITESSTIVNATVASGPTEPTNPDPGELFFNTTLGRLSVYTGSAWVEAGSAALADHVGNGELHLTTAQSTLLDNLSGGLTATELNSLDGVTGNVQTQLDNRLKLDGTNTPTANLNLNNFKLTNVGTPTSNGDATNLSYVETEISRSVPAGLRGQVPFIATDNSRTSVQLYTTATGQFIESDTELTLAQTRITSNATIFNEWYRFSHVAGLGGTLTRTSNVSRFQFTSANISTISAAFPVGGTVTITSSNTSFNGTFTITSVSASGSNHIIFFSQPGQPDVGTSVSGTIQLDSVQPAIPSELSAWTYNSGTDTIEATVNSDSYFGFISDRRYSSYVLEAQLSSTNSDDDTLGVVIAWAVSGGRECTLSAVRSTGGNGYTWRIVYNFGRADSQVLYEGTPYVLWGNGGSGADATASGYVSNQPLGGWDDFVTGTRVRITRNGDIITAETTNLGQTTYLTGPAVATINLTSLPVLAKFRGPTQYGFAASSQAAGSFKTLSFTDNQNAIYDIRNGNKYEYVSGAWAIQPGESLLGDMGPGRFLYDRYTQKLFYTEPELGAIKLVTNAGEGAAADVAQLESDFNTHVADQTVHLTPAQNTLIDSITASATEINYTSGVTSPIQTQLDARLRRDGTSTMTGTLQMNNNRITGLLVDGSTAGTDAVTKAYVDAFVQGIGWRQSVRVATTTNITLSGLQTINGVTLVLDDRVLVKDQSTPAQNGIYLAAPGAWSRAPDADSPAELDSAAVFVREGAVDADSSWIQVTQSPTVGSSPIVWSRFASSGGAAQGPGINIISNVISVREGNGLAFSGNDLVVDATSNFTFTGGQLDLSNTGVTASTYGNSTTIPVFSVDGKGRITSVTNTAIAAGQPSDADLTAIAAIPNDQFGLITRTGNGAADVRSIAATGSGVTVGNANGVAGNPTINLNDTSSSIGGRIVSRDDAGSAAFYQLNAFNFHDSTGTYNVNLASGTVEGRGIVAGFSGGNYGGIGYNIRFTTSSGNWIAPQADTASLLSFAGGGMQLTGWATGSAGRALTSSGNTFAVTNTGNMSWSGVASGNGSGITNINYSQLTGTVPSGALSGTYNINITGSAGSAGSASSATVSSRTGALAFFDGTSLMGSTSQQAVSGNRGVDQAPSTFTHGIFADFKNSSLYGFGGNYTGLVTVAPWTSTTASTGDPSYQLAFTPAGANSISAPVLRLRAGIDSTWGGWSVILHSQNFNSYAPSVNGTGAFGTWAINITGNAETVDGFSASIGQAENTIPVRDGSGYVYFNYINSNTGNSENPTVSQVMVTNGSDGFLRKASIGHLTSSLSGTAPINITGSAGSVSFGNVINRPVASDWTSLAGPFVAGLLGWKNYGNSHVIFDASAGTAPNGASISNSVPQNAWTGTYPTLMGWNGANTYGVKVNRADYADGSGLASKASTLAQNGGDGSAMTFNWSGQGGQPSWLWGSNDGVNHYVWNPSNFSVNYANSAGSATTAGSAGQVTVNASNANSTYFLLWHSGNTIYNNSAAGGTSQVTLNPSNGLVTVGSLYSHGNVTAFSDSRLKKDVERIEGALSKVEALTGVTYRMIDSSTRSTGLIAQDVQKVLPEAVSEHETGYLGVAYGNMMGLMVEAIKELKAEIDAIKQQLGKN